MLLKKLHKYAFTSGLCKLVTCKLVKLIILPMLAFLVFLQKARNWSTNTKRQEIDWCIQTSVKSPDFAELYFNWQVRFVVYISETAEISRDIRIREKSYLQTRKINHFTAMLVFLEMDRRIQTFVKFLDFAALYINWQDESDHMSRVWGQRQKSESPTGLFISDVKSCAKALTWETTRGFMTTATVSKKLWNPAHNSYCIKQLLMRRAITRRTILHSFKQS